MLQTAMRALRTIRDSQEKVPVKKVANNYNCESFNIANPSF